jgi:hypothetical protein
VTPNNVRLQSNPMGIPHAREFSHCEPNQAARKRGDEHERCCLRRRTCYVQNTRNFNILHAQFLVGRGHRSTRPAQIPSSYHGCYPLLWFDGHPVPPRVELFYKLFPSSQPAQLGNIRIPTTKYVQHIPHARGKQVRGAITVCSCLDGGALVELWPIELAYIVHPWPQGWSYYIVPMDCNARAYRNQRLEYYHGSYYGAKMQRSQMGELVSLRGTNNWDAWSGLLVVTRCKCNSGVAVDAD